ncbi:MAG TPA: hypothetical protein VM121_00490 [Acidimicrobiales bacterium]|nr:hypothetical protein [Acidimicrobiales bacterium]
MTWLASLPAGLLVSGSLAFALLVAAASRTTIRALVPDPERDHVQAIAAPLMPALGAAFAVLMALTLASEAAYLRSAQDIVSTEAAEASRLAWTATGQGAATAPIQGALGEYLRATRASEWRGGGSSERADPRTARALANLQRVVRTEAARTALGTPTSTELLASLDALTMERRDRLAAASHKLPVLYIVTLIASGVALIVNAGALTFRSSVRPSLLVAGLAVVVALSLALLFALSAPWDGALIVSGQPIDSVLRDLEAGFFRT